MSSTIFVTVGTTNFVELVKQITSLEFQKAALSKGYDQIILQYGNCSFDEHAFKPLSKLTWKYFSFTDDIYRYINQATLIIGHSGAGTVLDVLRGPILAKESVRESLVHKQLLVVPNNQLMDNHQMELALELKRLGIALSSSVNELIHSLPMADSIKADDHLSGALPSPSIGSLQTVIRSCLFTK